MSEQSQTFYRILKPREGTKTAYVCVHRYQRKSAGGTGRSKPHKIAKFTTDAHLVAFEDTFVMLDEAFDRQIALCTAKAWCRDAKNARFCVNEARERLLRQIRREAIDNVRAEARNRSAIDSLIDAIPLAATEIIQLAGELREQGHVLRSMRNTGTEAWDGASPLDLLQVRVNIIRQRLFDCFTDACKTAQLMISRENRGAT